MKDIFDESDRRFRELADLLPVIAFETDLKGHLVYVNNYATKLFGYSRDEFISHPVFIYIAAEDRERAISNSRRVMAGEYLGNNEYMAVKKGNIRFSVLIQTAPIKNDNDELTGMRGVLVDIDAQKKTEAQLRESEAYSASLFMNSPNPVIVMNPDYTIRKVNPAFETLSGYSGSEVIGLKRPYPWWPPDQHEHFRTQNDWAGNKESYERERCYRRKNGEAFWVVLSIRQVNDKNRLNYFIVNWVDISERKRMESQNIALYELEKRQREILQEEARLRGLYIDVLAHELRTPLTPVLASTSILKDLMDNQPDDIQKRLTANIFASTQTLVRRLEELLELARFARGAFTLNIRPTPLKEFFEDVIARFRPSLIQMGQELKEDLQFSSIQVEIDDSRLEQVIVNLLSNASKFSRGSGTILLKAREDEHHLQVDITDNGIGISPELQERLFQPYHRAEQDRQQFPGLGLGLAVAKQIVEAHSGKIWLISKPGRGSTFSFRIPDKRVRPVDADISK
jgi:PAS domain S-box-containing protein